MHRSHPPPVDHRRYVEIVISLLVLLTVLGKACLIAAAPHGLVHLLQLFVNADPLMLIGGAFTIVSIAAAIYAVAYRPAALRRHE